MSLTLNDLQSLKPAILKRLEEFSLVPRSRWQRELMICLLTPQSSPVRAEACMSMLTDLGFFEGNLTEETVAEVLRTPRSYIRFHNVKSRRLIRFRNDWPELEKKLRSCASQYEERKLLVKNVDGFGWKEASHALRNIGRRNLAILDRHILRNLVALGVIESIPASISERIYHEIEEKFRQFSESFGEELDVLDLYFWHQGTGFIFK